MYLNFEDYLKGEVEDLIEIDPNDKNKGGRPFKPIVQSLGDVTIDDFENSYNSIKPNEQLAFNIVHDKNNLLTKRAGTYGHVNTKDINEWNQNINSNILNFETHHDPAVEMVSKCVNQTYKNL